MSQSTSFKQGGYIKCGQVCAKILAEINGVYLKSNAWIDPTNREEYEKESHAWLTAYELEREFWSPCTPEEAGVPEDKWVPSNANYYFAAWIDESGRARYAQSKWSDDYTDKSRIAIGNVHKTSEDAIAWAKKRYLLG